LEADDVDAIVAKLPPLAKLAGDSVSELLIGGVRGGQGVPLQAESRRLLGRQQVRRAQPQGGGDQVTGTNDHGIILLMVARSRATSNSSPRIRWRQAISCSPNARRPSSRRYDAGNRSLPCDRQTRILEFRCT